MRPQRPQPQTPPPHPPAQPTGQRPPAQAARPPRRRPRRRPPAAAPQRRRRPRPRPAAPPRRPPARRPGPRPRAAAPPLPQRLRRRRAARPPPLLPGPQLLHPWPAQPRRPQRQRPPERRPLSHPARQARQGGPAAALPALPGQACCPGQAPAGRQAAGASRPPVHAASCGAWLERRHHGQDLRRMDARSGVHGAQPSAEPLSCWPTRFTSASHLSETPSSAQGPFSAIDISGSIAWQRPSTPAAMHSAHPAASFPKQPVAAHGTWDIIAGASTAGAPAVKACCSQACMRTRNARMRRGQPRRACPGEPAAAGRATDAAHCCGQAPLCACLQRGQPRERAVTNQSSGITGERCMVAC